MISGFCHNANEIFTLLEFYTTLIGSLLPTCQGNLSVPSSRVEQFKNNTRNTEMCSYIGVEKKKCSIHQQPSKEINNGKQIQVVLLV
jgi:hypothetical protein